MRKCVKFLIVSVIVMVASNSVQAQKEFTEGSGFFDRVYLGGNFGAQFGSVTYIDLSPLAGYMINQNLSAGVGITYQYLKYRAYDISFSTYGWRTFARRNIGRQLFVHGEFENLNIQFYNPSTADGIYRDWVPGLFLGGGMFQPIGQRGGFMITALYNVLYDDLRSPYNSPVVLRLGFTF